MIYDAKSVGLMALSAVHLISHAHAQQIDCDTLKNSTIPYELIFSPKNQKQDVVRRQVYRDSGSTMTVSLATFSKPNDLPYMIMKGVGQDGFGLSAEFKRSNGERYTSINSWTPSPEKIGWGADASYRFKVTTKYEDGRQDERETSVKRHITKIDTAIIGVCFLKAIRFDAQVVGKQGGPDKLMYLPDLRLGLPDSEAETQIKTSFNPMQF